MSDHESEDEFDEGATGFGSDLEESDDEAGGFGDNDFSEDEEDKPKPVPVCSPAIPSRHTGPLRVRTCPGCHGHV